MAPQRVVPRSAASIMVRLSCLLLTLTLASGAAVMNWWVGAPAMFAVAVLLTGVAFLLTGLARGGEDQRYAAWGATLVLALTVFGVASLLCRGREATGWEGAHARVAWLMAAAAFLTGTARSDPSLLRRMRLTVMVWGGCGVIVSLAVSYAKNQAGLFYEGIVAGLLVLCLVRAWFQLGSVGIQVANTLILVLVGLPLADFLIFPADHRNRLPSPADRAYSFAVASKDRGAFVRWWRAYQAQENRLFGALHSKDSSGTPRLRPNTSTSFFQSRISINHLGFRGEEFALPKGRAYRIVALGASTTFGLTLDPEDRPWPELLEQMIRERLAPGRPVQVINAGIPGNTIKENVARLPREILPLKPDLIISYHGCNSFHFLCQGLPPTRGKAPPVYRRRPLRILGDFEHALNIRWFNHQQFAEPGPGPVFLDAAESEYGRAYQELIRRTRSAGVQLVLANYSMAVNEASDPEVIAFYEEVFPAVRWQMKANALHSKLVEQLADEHPEVCLLDTQSALDGQHERFIDIMHFAPDGKRLLAETMFEGIKDLLEAELALPPPQDPDVGLN